MEQTRGTVMPDICRFDDRFGGRASCVGFKKKEDEREFQSPSQDDPPDTSLERDRFSPAEFPQCGEDVPRQRLRSPASNERKLP
jgi:hypothetical protein